MPVADPIVELAEALVAHRPPTLVWMLRWVDDDKIDRAWAQSYTPTAMCKILGITLSETAPRVPRWAAGLARWITSAQPVRHKFLAEFVRVLRDVNLGESEYRLPPEAFASVGLCLAMMVDDVLPAIIADRLQLTLRMVIYVTRWTVADMVARANLIRKRYPVPPTLVELLARFNVGPQETPL